jgi:hypothetical protein
MEKGVNGVLDTSRAPKRFVAFFHSNSALRCGIRSTNMDRTNESIIKEMLFGSGTNDGQELYNAEQRCIKQRFIVLHPSSFDERTLVFRSLRTMPVILSKEEINISEQKKLSSENFWRSLGRIEQIPVAL